MVKSQLNRGGYFQVYCNTLSGGCLKFFKQNSKEPPDKVLQNTGKLKHVYVIYIVCFVPADKVPNNIIIICKKYHIETLIKEFGMDN